MLSFEISIQTFTFCKMSCKKMLLIPTWNIIPLDFPTWFLSILLFWSLWLAGTFVSYTHLFVTLLIWVWWSRSVFSSQMFCYINYYCVGMCRGSVKRIQHTGVNLKVWCWCFPERKLVESSRKVSSRPKPLSILRSLEEKYVAAMKKLQFGKSASLCVFVCLSESEAPSGHSLPPLLGPFVPSITLHPAVSCLITPVLPRNNWFSEQLRVRANRKWHECKQCSFT